MNTLLPVPTVNTVKWTKPLPGWLSMHQVSFVSVGQQTKKQTRELTVFSLQLPNCQALCCRNIKTFREEIRVTYKEMFLSFPFLSCPFLSFPFPINLLIQVATRGRKSLQNVSQHFKRAHTQIIINTKGNFIKIIISYLSQCYIQTSPLHTP